MAIRTKSLLFGAFMSFVVLSSRAQADVSSANSVTAAFHYLKAKPTIVNGEERLPFRYYSCLKSIDVSFESEILMQLARGEIYARGRYRADMPFVFVGLDDTNGTVSFEPAKKDALCANNFPYEQIVFGHRSSSLEENATTETVFDVVFERKTNDRQEAKKVWFRDLDYSDEQISHDGQMPERELRLVRASDHCVEYGRQCLANLRPTTRLSKRKVSNAILALEKWKVRESRRSLYGQSDKINRIKLSDTILVPRGPSSTSRHFGFQDTNYHTRRASKWIEYIFHDVKEIGLADMTTASGETPYVDWGGGEKTYLHPRGSHQGRDVDIGYISIGKGNERDKAIDIEKNFWILHNLLNSVGVDLIYTAYKQQFIDYAQSAFKLGLISAVALSRFKSAVVIADNNLNHDTHFHARISYLNYDLETQRFRPSNSAYHCFLGARNRYTSIRNFCL